MTGKDRASYDGTRQALGGASYDVTRIPGVKKKDTCMRRSISAYERLAATLRYLATGRTYEDIKFSVVISPQRLGKIIPETCQAIWNVLHKDYMKVTLFRYVLC